MIQLSDDKLLNYNKQGLIPGPCEEEQSFIERAEYCLHLHGKLGARLPFPIEDEGHANILMAAVEETASLYDFAPKWVPIFFSNYQLTPWHGGCAWIFQMEENEPTSAFFQLRSVFKKSSKYLGIYDRNELIAHELVHVGRMMFEEPKFEEILAYKTSKNAFRRWCGPIVQSSTESIIFVCLLMPIIFFDLYFIFSDNSLWYWKMMWLKLLPLGLVLYAALRLFYRQLLFQKTLGNLSAILGAKALAEYVTVRLTDAEIENFSSWSINQIKHYIESQNCLRWRTIILSYYKTKIQ